MVWCAVKCIDNCIVYCLFCLHVFLYFKKHVIMYVYRAHIRFLSSTCAYLYFRNYVNLFLYFCLLFVHPYKHDILCMVACMYLLYKQDITSTTTFDTYQFLQLVMSEVPGGYLTPFFIHGQSSAGTHLSPSISTIE